MEQRPKSSRPWESSVGGDILLHGHQQGLGPSTPSQFFTEGALAGLDGARLDAWRPGRAGIPAQLKDTSDWIGPRAKSWAEFN